MNKCRIIVYDYDCKISKYRNTYEVGAWCVQGSTGFRAFFTLGNFLVEAKGDDGHWQVMDVIHKHWIPEFKKVVSMIEMEEEE